jgi:hypothetical protein
MSRGVKNTEISTDGWAVVARSFEKSLVDVDKNKLARLSVKDVKLPDSAVSKKTHACTRQQLPERTFNHSMRVAYFGHHQCHFRPPTCEHMFAVNPLTAPDIPNRPMMNTTDTIQVTQSYQYTSLI